MPLERAPKGSPKPMRYVLGGEEVFNSRGQEGWRLRYNIVGTRKEKLHWGSYESAVIALAGLKSGQDISVSLMEQLKTFTTEYKFLDGEERPRTTWMEHEGNRKRYLEPALKVLKWEAKPIATFTAVEVDKVFATCKPLEKKNLSDSVKRSIRKTMRMTFADAKRKGFITENVAAGFNTAWKPTPIEKFIPTPQQMLLVAKRMDSAQGGNPYWGSMLEFLYFTGLRISEAQALKLTDIHGENSYLHVQGKATVSGGRKVESKATKTALSNRHVTLLPEARFSLSTLEDNAKGHNSLYLFCGQGRRAHRKDNEGNWVTIAQPESIGYSTLSNALYQACNEAVVAGEIPERFTLHGCRHGYATMLRSVGIPDTTIAEEMGHASSRLVKTLYGASKFDVNQTSRANAQSDALKRLLDPPERDPHDFGAVEFGPLFPGEPDSKHWRDNR